MLKKIAFQLHWIVGITIGAILSFSGLTGGLMAFGPELTTLFSGGYTRLEDGGASPLSAAELYARIHAAIPSRRILDLTTYDDLHRPAMVHFAVPATFIGPTAPIPETHMVDRYSGTLMPYRPLGHAIERSLHWLHEIHQGHWGAPGALLPRIGVPLIGWSTLCLFVMALSGLYLRWPRGKAVRDWRSWFRIHPRLKGRAFLWNLHSVIGTCVLLVYLISAHSGEFHEMGWYGGSVRALVGLPPTRQGAPGAFGSPSATKTVRLISMPSDGYVDAAGDQINARMSMLDTQSGAISVQSPEPRPKNFGEALAADNQLLHEGRIGGRVGTAIVAAAALGMPVFYVTGWMMYLHRRRQKRRRHNAPRPQLAAEMV